MTQLNVEIRDGVLEHATRLKQLVHDPTSFMTELLVQQQQFTCLHWLWRFDIPARVPLPPASRSYKEVAKDAGVPETTLRASARMVMTMDFFCETVDGRLSHNGLSASFVRNPHLSTWIRHCFNQNVPLMGGMIKATEKYGHTTRRNETAYNAAHETTLSFFEHLKSLPDLEHEFDQYMKSQSIVHQSTSVEHLLQAFEWDSLGDGALVVDVGGGSGSASITVAKAHPKLKFLIQDQKIPITNARQNLEGLPDDVTKRIELMEHNFFEPQPVTGADVYLLRMIIHDWPDSEAIKILRQVAQAMKTGSRILIMDMVLPSPGSGSRTFEAALRQKDLSMLLTFNAKERELYDWFDLVQKVDSRLQIRAVRRPDACQHSVIEVVLNENEGETITTNKVDSNGVN